VPKAGQWTSLSDDVVSWECDHLGLGGRVPGGVGGSLSLRGVHVQLGSGSKSSRDGQT
jgi:hypothetical protein